MKRAYLVILNFNGGGEVIRCLKSLIGEGKRDKWRKMRMLVVDNGSTDGSLDEIKKIIKINQIKSKVKVIENQKNIGFAAGNNVGIKHALRKGANAVMLLNQDTIVQKNFLKPLLESPADIVAPVIKFKRDGEWVYDYGGKIYWWLGKPSHIEKRGSSSAIDYVSGCAMLIKRSVLEKIGLLNEKYFLYFEDVDFCLRAQKAGFKIAAVPKSSVLHKLVEKNKKPLKQHLNLLKSNLIFINTWVPLAKRPFAYLNWWLLTVKIFISKLQK